MDCRWTRRFMLATAALAAGVMGWAGAPRTAAACGGFFCSAANPVNQAAEQIVFAHHGDGSVTAIIQIMYEGPAEKFAWVLPVPGVPDVEVSSEQALDALKQQTNPTYQLNTVFGDGCQQFGFGNAASGPVPAPQPGIAFDAAEMAPAVMVEGTGTVGPFDWVVISVNPDLDDRADVAVDWLGDNGYDVTSVGPDVLRPYLDDGLNLIAFRLTKGTSSGSIRPVMITYESDLPMIPIRPTAVAANENMGVLVWTLATDRGIPKNYKALELNEALIDWFNPGNNYDEVVSAAADEAQGQGFVTEFAGSTDAFENTIFPQWQRDQWQSFQSREFVDAFEMVSEAMRQWGSWDGFTDALDGALTIPPTLDPRDVRLCLRCYQNEPGFNLDQGAFLVGLFEMVIKPMMDTQDLIDSLPYMTRLYTTMSADEMTLDPIFAFNAELDDVSNVHTADRVVECDEDNPDPFDAPWRVELPQGDSVEGTEQGVWPIEIEDQPAALKIIQYSTSGQGEVIEDRVAMVADMIATQNEVTTTGVSRPGSEPTSSGSGTAGGGAPGGDPASGEDESRGVFGCSVSSASAGNATGLAPLALSVLALAVRRRRRR